MAGDEQARFHQSSSAIKTVLAFESDWGSHLDDRLVPGVFLLIKPPREPSPFPLALD